MELRYRSISHESLSPTVKTVETDRTAKFFGQTYSIRRPVYQPYQQKLNLVYRGVAYSTGHASTALPQPSAASHFIAKLAEQIGI
jgi:hypothetical protein